MDAADSSLEEEGRRVGDPVVLVSVMFSTCGDRWSTGITGFPSAFSVSGACSWVMASEQSRRNNSCVNILNGSVLHPSPPKSKRPPGRPKTYFLIMNNSWVEGGGSLRRLEGMHPMGGRGSLGFPGRSFLQGSPGHVGRVWVAGAVPVRGPRVVVIINIKTRGPIRCCRPWLLSFLVTTSCHFWGFRER